MPIALRAGTVSSMLQRVIHQTPQHFVQRTKTKTQATICAPFLSASAKRGAAPAACHACRLGRPPVQEHCPDEVHAGRRSIHSSPVG